MKAFSLGEVFMEGFFLKIYKRRNEIVFLFRIVWVAFIYLFIIMIETVDIC